MTPALEAENASKQYGDVLAVDGVDLTVARGETLVLIGESGCGKTTLLRMFNRLIDPTAGTVRAGGQSIATLDPIELRRRTGYVQQEGGLLPHWTVAKNVALVPRLAGWDAGRRRARTDELLDMVGLEPSRFADRHPNELSGGQRQRVAFARALAVDPDVVLLDEPFGALDAITRRELQDEFLRLKQELQKTMLVVTHDLDEAARLGDRIAVMRDGRILQCDTAQQLAAAPASDYVSHLLSHQAPVALR